MQNQSTGGMCQLGGAGVTKQSAPMRFQIAGKSTQKIQLCQAENRKLLKDINLPNKTM